MNFNALSKICPFIWIGTTEGYRLVICYIYILNVMQFSSIQIQTGDIMDSILSISIVQLKQYHFLASLKFFLLMYEFHLKSNNNKIASYILWWDLFDDENMVFFYLVACYLQLPLRRTDLIVNITLERLGK